MKQIPYGLASYKNIREKQCYYLDKTPYIPKFEHVGEFLFFIRPRRFGKSLLLTLLECYYDISRQAEYDLLFKDTFIYTNPTPEKNAYLILKFDFSQVNPDPDMVESSFKEYTDTCFFFFGERYVELLGERYFKMIEQKESPHSKLEFLLRYVGSKGHKVYILIDEYDNFANTILTSYGQSAYHKLTHGSGFFRFFFNILKGSAGQTDSGVGRLFITGVSPVTMDDVTSGFNIGKNISLHPHFNELLGFTQPDVLDLLNYYGITNDVLPLMQDWYDHYRFATDVTESIFNTDMVLYFVDNFLRLGHQPDNLIDQNVRIDYGKLRHLMVLDRRLNGNFSRLTEIIEQEETSVHRVADTFPVERLTKPSNFISLLYYFGLLSYTPAGTLKIPNQTVKQLMYSYIRDGYEDVDVFSVDLWCFADLVRQMAYRGEWQPVFAFLAAEVEKQTSIRDYLTGEKVIQTFLLAYLNVTDYYITHTETEMGKGFVDLYLEPFWAKYNDVKYAYLIELKYLTRSEFTEDLMKAKLTEAKTQLQQYATDARVIKQNRAAPLICLALVFSGWELKAMEAI